MSEKPVSEWTPADHVAFWRTRTPEELVAAKLSLEDLETMSKVTALVEEHYNIDEKGRRVLSHYTVDVVPPGPPG
jgi:hypothetical protein